MDPFAESRQGNKRAIWQNHIAAWRESGLSQHNYCQSHGIALATFGYWRRKLRTEQPGKPQFYPLIVAAEEPAGREDSGTIPLRLVLGNQRFIVEIGESFSPTVLKQLITTLECL